MSLRMLALAVVGSSALGSVVAAPVVASQVQAPRGAASATALLDALPFGPPTASASPSAQSPGGPLLHTGAAPQDSASAGAQAERPERGEGCDGKGPRGHDKAGKPRKHGRSAEHPGRGHGPPPHARAGGQGREAQGRPDAPGRGHAHGHEKARGGKAEKRSGKKGQSGRRAHR